MKAFKRWLCTMLGHTKFSSDNPTGKIRCIRCGSPWKIETYPGYTKPEKGGWD